VREMPVLAAARFIGITDKRLWRIVGHDVHRAVAALDLWGHARSASTKPQPSAVINAPPAFLDMDRRTKPVIVVTPGKGKACVAEFRAFLLHHGGEPTTVAEVVWDMSPAVLAALAQGFPNRGHRGLVPRRSALHHRCRRRT
jgi:transposase